MKTRTVRQLQREYASIRKELKDNEPIYIISNNQVQFVVISMEMLTTYGRKNL